MIHPVAWLVWLGGAVAALSLQRNPLYLLITLLACGLVARSARRRGEGTPTPVAPLRFALTVVPLAALLNALLTEAGSTVLLRLPEALPVVGGALTAEALAYGATNGLVLTALLTAFAALTAALPTRELIRLVPRAFYPLAVVLSVAVGFVPSVLRQIEQVREAQAIRGHRMRGLRDWLPLFLPLLIGGLERALQLAEALTARGFVVPAGPHRPRRQAASVVALLLLTGGLLTLFWGARRWGLLALGGGALLLLLLLWGMGKRVATSSYRRVPWSSRAGWVVVGTVGALLPLLLLARGPGAYSPYPRLTPPPFDPRVGLPLLGLLLPALALEAERP
jgi:energy-coupling factor transport system permease protein